MLPNLTRLTITRAEVPVGCQRRLAQLSRSLIALNLGADGLLGFFCDHPLTAAALCRLTRLTGIWLGRMTFDKGTRFQVKETVISHVWQCCFDPEFSGLICVHLCACMVRCSPCRRPQVRSRTTFMARILVCRCPSGNLAPPKAARIRLGSAFFELTLGALPVDSRITDTLTGPPLDAVTAHLFKSGCFR